VYTYRACIQGLKAEKLLKDCRCKECAELKEFNSEVIEGCHKKCMQEVLERFEDVEDLQRIRTY
jgi:hypothetical protein